MIRIALPKGNVLKKSQRLACNLLNVENVSALRMIGDEFEIYFVKHRDIPYLVDSGYVDIGITSEEWLVETNSKLSTIMKTDWCNTRISYIEPKQVCHNGHVRCVTEFPNIAKQYFEKKGQKTDVCKVSGSCEAYVPTIFECCIDCVETGMTLLENELIEKEVIMHSQIVAVLKQIDNISCYILERLKKALNDEAE